MNCAFDKEKLTGYYDGELEAAEKAEVERHIASCSECLRELGELKSAAILVKELPRLRAPRSIAEGVSREMQAAGKVHSFAKVRRTVLWASAAAAALFVGLNVMYFSSEKSAAPMAAARPPAAPSPIVLGKVQQPQQEEVQKAGGKEADSIRRGADRQVDEAKLREARKSIEAEKPAIGRDDPAKKVAEAPPADRAREKEKADGLAKAPADARPAEPAPAPKPTAAPGAAPAPVVKSAPPPAPPPAPEAAEKGDFKKVNENLARSEAELKGGKRSGEPAADAGPTHLTLAATQLSKARPQVEAALRKMGVALPPPPPPVKNMKAPMTRETEPSIPLELTDAQIARLRQELDNPGSSRLVNAAPGDPVLAEFRDTGMFAGKKEAAAASGGGAKAKADAPKPEAKPEAKADPKDAKESKDADAPARALGASEGLADKSAAGPRRKVVLHLLEVPYVPLAQPAGDSIKK